MRLLSFLRNDEIVDQIPTILTDEQVIDLDEFLRKLNLLKENEEIAITTLLLSGEPNGNDNFVLSFLRNDEIVDQIPTKLTDKQANDLDNFLRKLNLLKKNEEIGITIKRA